MSVLTEQEKGDLRRRVVLLPVPVNVSIPVLNLFCRWCENSGKEWSIQRFKSIKADFIRLFCGEEPLSTWIAKSGNGKTVFKGAIGSLEHYAMQSEKTFGNAIQLLQMYSFFTAEVVTPKQWKKFVQSTQADPQPVSHSIVNAVLNAARIAGLEFSVGLDALPRPLIQYISSPSKRAPAPSRKSWFSSLPEVEAVIDSLYYLVWSKRGYELMHDDKHRLAFNALLEGLESSVGTLEDELFMNSKGSDEPDEEEFFFEHLPVGKVSFLQESGYKLRYVANPARVFQRLLEPLGDALFGLLKTLPWDCTHDQSKAYGPVQKHLSTGKPAFSVDLKSATDYFPLDLQIELLQFICRDPHGYVDLFHDLSRGDWYVQPPEGGPYTMKWTKGQPLGLYPSFASFALTHGILLFALCQGKYTGQFYVLGDDVIILDAELANRYSKVLEVLGCPISPEKTVVGPMAEFSGKLITSRNVIPQLKWRDPSDDSFVDIARLLGPGSLNLFRSEQRRVLKAISMVPEFCGGLGWNPEGKPIQERLPKWALSYERAVKEAKTKNLDDQVRTFYSSFLTSCLQSYKRYGLKPTTMPKETLDQRAQDEVSRLLGSSFVPMTNVLGSNLDKVARDLGIDLSLPYSVYTGSRTTQLERWKAILRTA